MNEGGIDRERMWTLNDSDLGGGRLIRRITEASISSRERESQSGESHSLDSFASIYPPYIYRIHTRWRARSQDLCYVTPEPSRFYFSR